MVFCLRIFLLFFGLQFATLNSSAQVKKYMVTFKNKGFNTFSLANPSAYLSARAIAKRIKFGVVLDSADLPITARYIDSVRKLPNVTILGFNKWFNRLVIATNDATALAKIQSYNFVVNNMGVNRVLPLGTGVLLPGKFNTENGLDITGARVTEIYSYGNGSNQINIHNGEFLHAKGFTGANINIGVIDNGFATYLTHGAIDSARLQSRIFDTYDFVDNETNVNDNGAHGLNCLSQIAGNKTGILVGAAPKANFALYRTEDDNSEMPIEEINLAMALERADSAGIDVVSISLGYYDFDNALYNYTPTQMDGKTTYAAKAAAIAAKKGILVVNSAGNEGANAWQYITTPSDADSVLCVGACTFAQDIWAGSSKGIPSQNRIKPNVAAMGIACYLARPNNNYGYGNGTSYACPTIAGLASCLWQAYPQFNNIKIFDVIQRSSHKYTNPDLSFGYGIPNFKIAYYLLKKDENFLAFGNNWLLANPNPFVDTLQVKFISQITGQVTIQLLNAANMVLYTNMVAGTEQDWATTKFINLTNLAAGNYTIKYTDANGNTKTVAVTKLVEPYKNWLTLTNTPITAATQVRLQAPNTGNFNLQLYNAKGSLLETKTITAINNMVYFISFNKFLQLQKGIYYIKVSTPQINRLLKLIK